MSTQMINTLFKPFFITLLLLLSAGTYAANDHDNETSKEHEQVELAKGPHKGRLLVKEKFVVELAIFEQGVPPEYRAWASLDGKPISPKEWQLSVELTRLGGKVDKFHFAAQDDFLRGQSEVEEPHSFDVSVTATYKNQQHHWTFPSYEGRVQLSNALATQAGLTTAIAGAGKLEQHLKLYGQISAAADQVRKIKARFPGVVRSVNARVGTQVSAGQTLATVEANESLRSYNITSPITGVVVERTANEGEVTDEQALFVVADYRQLNVVVPIFSQDASRVKVGQKLHIKTNEQESITQIDALTPAADGSPTLTARASIDNTNNRWTAGSWVDASITFAEVPVNLMIDNRALQRFRDWQVVFIQVDDNYEIRPLELGKTDGQFTEVLRGLNAGDRYVVNNSYLLKADLEKSGAAHDH